MIIDHEPPPEKVISFHGQLSNAVSDFLCEQGWHEPGVKEVVTELAATLAKYREEGRRLFPVVFIARDLQGLLTEVDGHEPLIIGRGPIDAATVRRAVKHCAPLGEGRSWVVFMEVKNHKMVYGVFRTGATAIDPTSLEKLRRAKQTVTPLIGVVQLAENVVELRISKDHFRYLYLFGAAGASAPPTQTTRRFINALIRDADDDLKAALGNFYYRIVLDVMQVWHGSLSVVIPKGGPIPDYLTDGVILDPPVDLQKKLRLDVNAGSHVAGWLSASHLIRGMMGSDGITLLGSDGSVLGYNVFMQQSEYPQMPVATEGGARRRTYNSLCQHVGKTLVAAFYRSQDGNSNCTSELIT
jgi:hypothetical protein